MSSVATQQTQQASGVGFEPRIVAFVCKWCTYAGADLAGTSRMVYPPNVRALMLPCTGRIDISFVLRAFLQGADGVLVSGCHPGDCHYTAGNFRARRRWMLLRDLLDVLGFDLRRLDMAWISAAEGAKWVKTIQTFTDRIRELGPYNALHRVAQDRSPAAAPAVGVPDGLAKAERKAAEADPKLVAAVAESLTSGATKAVIGWTKSGTLAKPRPAWITSAEAAQSLVAPAEWGNLARLLKNPQVKQLTPIGIVARSGELSAINVLIQESYANPASIVVFAVGADGKFLGTMDMDAANKWMAELRKDQPADRPVGFSDEVLKKLDDLMAKTPQERWAFWADQSAKCVKCYACRGSCPMCTCEQCFVEKNQPQWFPTAADGPGNLAWHIVRAFHLAGRCVGCGACQEACPAGIPLNLLSAALARSALKNFDHRAGVDPKGIPLQSDFKSSDKEDFIL